MCQIKNSELGETLMETIISRRRKGLLPYVYLNRMLWQWGLQVYQWLGKKEFLLSGGKNKARKNWVWKTATDL